MCGMDFLEKARELEAQLVAWRRDIHMHPELGFEETRTARLVADTLRALDMEVEVGVGITGVVGRLGQGRPVIGIRADMDALPIQEANEVPYKSQTPGVMHACGHDAHTAMLLGVARMLHEMPDRPPGEIRFLFQPSEEKWDEEIKSGATRMIDDRALDGVDAVIALHVSSQTPSGVVEIGEGHMLAAVDTFRITIKGQGCHGALPHTGIDPIYIQAQVVNAIQGIRSRRLDPTQPAVVTIGSIHGGQADNVIPQEVHLTGTIRSFTEEIRSQVHDELARALDVARALGGDYSLTIERGYPSLYNDPAVAQLIQATASDLIGAEHTRPGTPIMGAEDFAYMAQQAPGAMFMLGAQIGHDNRPHHSPIFDIDEGAMPVGAAVLAGTAVRLLREYA
jgi:amidohydrolase